MEEILEEAVETSSSIISGRKKFTEDGPRIYTQLSLEMKEDESIDYMKELLEPVDIAEIAKKVYSEENLYIYSDKIHIRFPEFEITNSIGSRHKIRDLIVKVKTTKNSSSSTQKISISISALRTTCTINEITGGYSHSHTEGSSYGRFNEFCLGSSDFAIIKGNVSLSPTATNWMLFFMALESYVKWESLEGGPYMKIEQTVLNRTSSVHTTTLKQEALRLSTFLPIELVDVNTFSIVPGRMFTNFVNDNSRIRRMQTSSPIVSNESIESALSTMTSRCRGIKWKEGQLMFAVIPNDIIEKEEENNLTFPVEETIVNYFMSVINTELLTFKQTQTHEQYKKRNYRTPYSLGETKADSDRGVTTGNRLPSF